METLKLMRIETSVKEVLGLGFIFENQKEAASVKQILDDYITNNGRKYFNIVFASVGNARNLYCSIMYEDQEYDIIFGNIQEFIIDELKKYLSFHPYYFIDIGYQSSDNVLITLKNPMFKNNFYINNMIISGNSIIKFDELLLTEIRNGKHEEKR